MFVTRNVIAAESQTPRPSRSDDIPVDWILGSGFALTMVFFGVIWWVKGMAGKVELTEKNLRDIELKLIREREEDRVIRKEVKDELRHNFKSDLIQSENAISHSLELFMVEVRAEFKKIAEGLDARNQTVNRLGKKVDHLSDEMLGLTQQLQNQNISVHSRRYSDD
jgi:hypothetical protein